MDLSFQLQEIILMWPYQRSGSVWAASPAHAGNMVLFLILGETLDGRKGLAPVTPMLLALADGGHKSITLNTPLY
ncbi:MULTISPECIES: hypothetical protein [unclassified Streptomyces]|uniref:hypothetical protein n=1 Tax=unclassified Streptomyces TaxID=2593676 RepID=UPI000B83351F|nr:MULTISPECIES: hypothetical protein [unclassified Streptomyces]